MSVELTSHLINFLEIFVIGSRLVLFDNIYQILYLCTSKKQVRYHDVIPYRYWASDGFLCSQAVSLYLAMTFCALMLVDKFIIITRPFLKPEMPNVIYFKLFLFFDSYIIHTNN